MALYWRLLAAGIRARMQYKVDFLVSSVLYGVITAVDFLIVAVVLYRYHTVGGWNMYEVALLAGVTGVANGLYRTFAPELNSFERYLLTGDFDGLLIRPWSTLATLLSRSFDLGRVGAILQGLVLMTLGLKGAGVTAWVAVYAFLLPIPGMAVIIGLNLAVATAGFWITRIDELQTFAINAPLTAANFPMEIYPKWLRGIFTAGLPVAAMGYVPLRYALGKGGSPLSLLAPFLAAAGVLAVTLWFWQVGQRRYQSTGN